MKETKLCFCLQIDHLAIACMFNVNVDVFIYGSPLHPAHWERTAPVPELTSYVSGSYNDGSVTDIFLYHEENSHYDLLVPRMSSLAQYGPLSSQLQYVNMNDEYVSPIQDKILPTEVHETPNIRNLRDMSNNPEVSPLVFPPCPRGPGRPEK